MRSGQVSSKVESLGNRRGLDAPDELSHYLKLIGDCKPLSREEEQEAWSRGDTDLIVRSLLPLVVNIAKRNHQIYRGYGSRVSMDALISAGNLGLMAAVSKFKVPRGLRMITFAYRAIDWECRKEAIGSFRAMVGPKRQKEGYDKTVAVNTAGLDSLEDFCYEDEFVDDVEYRDQLAYVMKSMGCLDERQQDVLLSRAKGETLESIGNRYGISKERVRQVERGALRDIRRAIGIAA